MQARSEPGPSDRALRHDDPGGPKSWEPPTLLCYDAIRIVVREERIEGGRAEGEILQEFNARKVVEIGETLILSDGTARTVTSVRDRFEDDVGWQRTVHVRNL